MSKRKRTAADSRIATLERKVRRLRKQLEAAEGQVKEAECEAADKKQDLENLAEDMTYLGEPIAAMADKAACHAHDLRAICDAMRDAGCEFDGKTNVVRLIGQLIGQRDEARRLLAVRERRAEGAEE